MPTYRNASATVHYWPTLAAEDGSTLVLGPGETASLNTAVVAPPLELVKPPESSPPELVKPIKSSSKSASSTIPTVSS